MARLGLSQSSQEKKDKTSVSQATSVSPLVLEALPWATSGSVRSSRPCDGSPAASGVPSLECLFQIVLDLAEHTIGNMLQVPSDFLVDRSENTLHKIVNE